MLRVVDRSRMPVMTVKADPTKYTEEQLMRELQHRREMLNAPRVSREKLVIIGESPEGLIYMDAGNYYDIARGPEDD